VVGCSRTREAGLAEFELVLGGRGSLRLGEILGGEPAGRAADPPPPRVAAPAAVETAAHLSSCVDPGFTATPLLFPMFKFGFDLDLEVGATRSWMSAGRRLTRPASRRAAQDEDETLGAVEPTPASREAAKERSAVPSQPFREVHFDDLVRLLESSGDRSLNQRLIGPPSLARLALAGHSSRRCRRPCRIARFPYRRTCLARSHLSSGATCLTRTFN
jgi:hypothetical protein